MSPSQLKTWELCQRKWAYHYIEGLPDPGSAKAEFGQRVHKLLELWSVGGVYPAGTSHEEAVARKMLPFGPPPYAARTEGSFWFEAAGIRYRGFKDLEYLHDGLLTVHDWKTTSDLKWANDEETLRNDSQGLIYAADSLTRWKANRLAMKWVYGTTGSKVRTRVVRIEMTYDEIAEGFERVHVSAEQLVLARRQHVKATDLPATPSACSAFGGCPYRNNPCSLSQLERLRAIMDPMNSLKERAAQQAAAAQNGQQPPMQQNPSHPAPVPAQYVQPGPNGGHFVQNQDGSWQAVIQGQDGQYYPQPQFNPTAVNQPPAQQPQAATQAPQQPAVAPVIPVQQPPMQAAPPMQQAAPPMNGGGQPQLPYTQPQMPAASPTPPATPPQAAAEPEEAPKTRGRPKGSTSKGKTLTKDEQIWLAGVQATMANPTFGNGQLTTDLLVMSGDMAVQAYHQRFGE